MRMSASILLIAFALFALVESQQPAFAEGDCPIRSPCYFALVRAFERQHEADLKKKHREEAAARVAAQKQKKQMEDELAWEKANKAKPAEPGVVTQKCYYSHGNLICN